MRDSNKQLLLVLFFFIFIIVSVVGVIFYDNKKTNEETSSVTSNIVEDVPDVSDSKEIVIITSNSNSVVKKSNSNSKSNGNKKSNVNVSNKKSNNNTKSNKNNEILAEYYQASIKNNKIYVGGTTILSVEVFPKNATKKIVTFSTSDSNIATVSQDGVIRGVKPGTCYININVVNVGSSRVPIQVISLPTPSNSNKSNSNKPVSNSNKPVSNSNKPVSNSNKPISNSNSNSPVRVTGVKLDKTSATIKKNSTMTLTATVSPSNAANKNVTWTSSNTGVATVNSSGKVTGVAPGTATITVTTVDGAKKATATIKVEALKNGWYTENGKKYYYRDGVKLKNQYVEYVYLDKDGVAQAKIGNFDATLYGATAWVASFSSSERYLCLRSGVGTGTSKNLAVGTKLTIMGEPQKALNGYRYIKVKVNSTGETGYVVADHIFINLPDVIPGIYYNITNASSAIYKSAGYKIPNVTGEKLYKFSKSYNAKIGRSEYLAPLLYPVAEKLQVAYNAALTKGYSFKIYDTYRPQPVAKKVSDELGNLMNKNKDVYNAINKTVKGFTYNKSWFIANNGSSRHCRGIAIDMALTDKKGNDLKFQSAMHMLDTSAVTEYNTTAANDLNTIMTSNGFNNLRSEWWHFEIKSLDINVNETFYVS